MIKKAKVDAGTDPEKIDRYVDISTIKHKNVCEVGTEWLCYQAAEQIGIGNQLKALGWSEEKVQLALTQIVSRAVYPFSELKTSKIIKETET